MDQQIQTQNKPLSRHELAMLRKKRRLARLKQKKLDRKQKLLEKKKNLLKDYLAREIKYGQHTLRKYQVEWEKMLTTIAIPKKIEEIELTQQNFEQVMDIKDYIISCLMDILRESEDHYVLCLNMHISKVDEMIDKFHSHLIDLRNDYKLKIRLLKDKDHDFIREMGRTKKTNIDYLKSMTYGLEFGNKEEEMNLKAGHCAEEEIELDKQELLLLKPRIEYESMLRYIYESKNKVLRTYKMKTQTQRKDYEAVKEANGKFEELSSKALGKIDYLNRIIRRLRNKENEIRSSKLEELNCNLKIFQTTYLKLKQNLTADLKIDKHKQELLVWTSLDSFSRMTDILKRGQNLVRFLQCCRRLESSDDKVRPYPMTKQKKETDSKARLFLFLQKVGKVNASRSGIMEEKMILTFQNKSLRKFIKDFCICPSCPKLPPICRKEGPIPFTEGIIMMRKYETTDQLRRR